MRTWIFGIVLLVMVIVIGQVNGATTRKVDDDIGPWAGYQTIQDAINASEDGDTILVYNGTYFENLIIDVEVTITGNGSDETVLNGTDTLSANITANNVTFSGFNVTGIAYGINVTNVTNCFIDDCLFYWNQYGLWVWNTEHITVTWCEFINNTEDASAFMNSIWIEVAWSSFIGNWGTSIAIGWGSSDALIANCTVDDNHDNGIYTWETSGITIIDNSVVNTRSDAVFMDDCWNVEFHRNNISDNTDTAIDVMLIYDVIVMNNTFARNGEEGIELFWLSNWTIAYNEFIENGWSAIRLRELVDNCTIYMNNFYQNNGTSVQAIDNGTDNQWDNGTHGNYWSDYGGTDGDEDGIGDTPYLIGGTNNSADRYPLMNTVKTEAPEKVPELPIVLAAFALIVGLVAIGRRKRR